MSQAKRAFLGAMAVTVVAVAGCLVFVDNPGATSAASGSSSASGGVADAGHDGDDDEEPTLCDKLDGYDAVAKVVDDVVVALVADCRISAFFTALSTVQRQHFGDCLAKQVGVLMRCPLIKYDVDSNGMDCRDMKTSHHGLAIRASDFEAFLEDVVATLKTDGFAQDDIDSVTPALVFLEGDIVTNSAPDLSKGICVDGGGDGG